MRSFILLLSLILTHSAVSPDVGSHTYGNVTIDSLDVFGIVKLKGTTISKLLKITGNLIAHDAHLQEVEAIGDIRLVDTILQQQVRITGTLQANGSQFQKPLLFLGQKALFSHCRVSEVTVQRDPTFKGKQLIELKDRTIIDGPIIFEGEGGLVFLDSGSKVLGPVLGGKIVHKPSFEPQVRSIFRFF